VKRVVDATDLPVTADLEGGYGNAAETVRRAIGIGVVGANIEDQMKPLPEAVAQVEAIMKAAAEEGVPDFVLNARTDAFHLGRDRDPAQNLAEAVERGKAFLDAGASVVFVPARLDENQIGTLVEAFGPQRLSTIAIPGSPSLARQADYILLLPNVDEACPHGLAPTTSTTMQLALGDALAIALLESSGFTAVDFGVFHPRGRLGAALKFVRDVMHPGAAVPMIGQDALMSAAIVEMSAKGFGCVAVTDRAGRLAGVITDGDLRRHMRDDLLQAPVREVMTASPKTVRPEQLASEALEIINASKITALIVVESDRPVGILHFHDLLRAGVA